MSEVAELEEVRRFFENYAQLFDEGKWAEFCGLPESAGNVYLAHAFVQRGKEIKAWRQSYQLVKVSERWVVLSSTFHIEQKSTV